MVTCRFLARNRVNLAVGLVVLAAVLLHVRTAYLALNSDLVSSDQPAHFVTGVMVYDYLRTAIGSSPLAFGEAYYVRFPKVAFGHWPPLYYAVQAVWYMLTGPSLWAARLLSAVITLVIAALLWFRARRTVDPVIAWVVVALWLALPRVQSFSWRVMAEMLGCLTVLMSMFALAKLIESPSFARMSWFGLWAVAAVLTKGNSWAMAVPPLLGPLMARRARCFLSKWYWGAGLAILAIGAPWYYLSRMNGIGYSQDAFRVVMIGHIMWDRFMSVLIIRTVAPYAMHLMGAVGLWLALRARWGSKAPVADTPTTSLEITTNILCGVWVIAQMLFQAVLPMTPEDRVYMPMLPGLCLVSAPTLQWIKNWLAERRPRLAEFSPALVGGLAIATFGLGVMWRVDGYGEMADAIPYDRGTIALLSSDAEGQGAIIARRLVRDRDRVSVNLRADKMITNSTWQGRIIALKVEKPEELHQKLQDVPVRYIVVDTNAPSPRQALLERTLSQHPEAYVETRRVKTTSNNGRREGELILYDNKLAAGKRAKIVRVNLDPERKGRELELVLD